MILSQTDLDNIESEGADAKSKSNAAIGINEL